MAERTLHDCRVLVVEDEYMLADELRTALEDAGAIVVGPVATVDDATARIEAEPRLDGAILDANLRGDMVYPVADLLVARGVPFIFTTGYDALMIPSRFAAVTRCEKPVDINAVTRAIGRALHG